MALNPGQQSNNAKSFIKEWSGSNYKEKGNVGKFWIELLEQVFGVDNGAKMIKREMSVPTMNKTTDFIDVYIPSTRVLIEQKAPTIDLTKKEYRPSFKEYGGYVTPFEQARTYSKNLPLQKEARWIITCNFHQFNVYDMNQSGTHPKPTIIRLDDLDRYYYQLDFLIDPTRQNIKHEEKVSVKACSIITKIYHELLNQYDKKTPNVYQSINKVCVRLVFCLYADDSGIFGQHGMFHKYMKNIPASLWRIALKQLFTILNQPENKRDSQLNNDLAQFPYVNGGMFADNSNHSVLMPRFNDKVKQLIIDDAGEKFDWSQISPTIFGSLFESTLNPTERHTNGMHYTSVQNIHKVIDPLFLNDLRHQLNVIKTKYKTQYAITKHAKRFQNELASLTFFDPACGSGNFLTETYLCLRKLENEAIKLIMGKNGQIQTQLGLGQKLIKVSIHQFYGIEINDFAVSVAKTAMWIAESQMVQKTQDIINQTITFLPLKSNPDIIKANALEINWTNLVNPKDLNYIISNPPFLGYWRQNKKQKADVKNVLKNFKHRNQLDYVACWYQKSASLMKLNPNIHTALVSTNSIVQGQQVPILWKPLLDKDKLHINFAYKSFKWINSAKKQAQVDCVIIALSHFNNRGKVIYKNINGRISPHLVKSGNINPYLRDGKNVFVLSTNKSICNATPMFIGNKPVDKGYLSKYSNKEKQSICSKYPKANKFFKKLLGAREFIHKKTRWCLWLYHTNPSEWMRIPPIVNAVKNVKAYRLKSSKKATRKDAQTPYLFQEHNKQPNSNYLLFPKTTSVKRHYIPIGFINKDIIATDKCFIIPNASYYTFGILQSIVHMIWTGLVSGRLGNGYEYTAKITYNTFPWPKVTNEQEQKISQKAQHILDVRKNYKKSSLADLYNPLSMPPELLKAHKANDRAVLKSYGLKSNASKNEILTKLLGMYTELTNN